MLGAADWDLDGWGAPADSYGQAIYADRPVAWYRLDGDATDYMGGLGGTMIGGTYAAPVAGNTPAGAQSASFDGLDDYIDVAAESQTNMVTGSAFSVECWLDMAAAPASVPGVPCGGNLYGLEISPSGQPGGFAPNDVFSTTATVTTGTPHHLVMTSDGTTVLVYLDGTQVASGAAGSTTQSTAPFRIGAYASTVSPNQFFNGTVDEVALYDVALTATQVAAHYSAGTVTITTITVPDSATSTAGLTVSASTSLTDAAAGDGALSVTARPSLADTAAGTDVLAVTIGKTLADTATAADALTVSSTAPLTDTAAAADALTANANTGLTDTATATDGVNVGVPVNVSDTATATDALAVTARAPLTDTGSGTDGLLLPGQVALADTATAVDSLSTTLGAVLADTGTAADTLAARATVPLADTGTGADGITSTDTDPLADGGTATDSFSVRVVITFTDVAHATDTVGPVTATVPVRDSATATDGLTWRLYIPPHIRGRARLAPRGGTAVLDQPSIGTAILRNKPPGRG